MGQSRTALRGGHTATVYPLRSIPAQNKHNRLERQRNDFIYLSVHNIGVELMMATGGAEITCDNLLALQFRGYLDYSLDEIFASQYEDIEDLNIDIRMGYEQRLEAEASREAQLLAEIEDSDLPAELFKKIEFIAVDGVSVKKKHKSGNSSLVKDVGVIQDEEVDFSERLSRYAKYKLAKKMLGEVRKDVSERRILGIAIGIFLSEEGDASRGKKISSYQSEIYKASNQLITQADVEMAASAAELYDLVYPERHKDYIDQLRQAAERPVIVPLGKKELLYPVVTSEISIDVTRKQLLLGETAVRAAIEKGANSEAIFKLSELLLANSVAYRLGELDPYRYKSWARQNYIDYGRWLLGLVQLEREDLNSRIIARARKLDLGPGIEGVANGKIFNDLPEFYEALGFTVRRHGSFSHWSAEEWIDWGRRVVSENGGKITREIIIARSQQNPGEPSFKMFKNAMGSITNLVEALGIEPYHKMMSTEECVRLGVSFYEQYGRMPQKKDFHQGAGLPSLSPIYKYCGGIVGFRELIMQSLSSSDRLRMAA